MNSFSAYTKVEAVLLGGGQAKDLVPEESDERLLPSKAFVKVGSQPLAARTLKALKSCPRISRVIFVCPGNAKLDDKCWEGVDRVLAQERMVDSFCRGVMSAKDHNMPVLIACGDLPFLTSAAVEQFVSDCTKRSEADIWYGYLRKECSQKTYPELPHTYAKFREGTFCGTGLMMIRPRVVPTIVATMQHLTENRKRVLGLILTLGPKSLLYYLFRRLTVKMAEQAGEKVFKVPCCGVESLFAEAGFNVDDQKTLELARKLAQV